MIIRPVRVSDLPAIERMAHDSGVGVTNLPDQRDTLFERICLSVRSFETDVATYGTEFYQFVLEGG
ncbi:arginine N-succinyltransferase [Aquaspirillum serpens]|uniref:arginine N-succinyltransferase n=1 Tax=Aquaspirillum serpens TaxID=190 RepID=UPI0004109CFD|nr:arginine N-succinyltransferase [Aquaspirillum serpens]